MKFIEAGKRNFKTSFNKIKIFVRKYWIMRPDFLKFPQTWLAISVLVVCLSFYLLCCDIQRFEFLVIVIVIPALAYAFGSYYYTSAVITVVPEYLQDKDKTLYIHADGKEYSIEKEFHQLKIYFSRKGKHSIYLYDKTNNKMVDSPQKANTYEHYIDYVEFKKKRTKAN